MIAKLHLNCGNYELTIKTWPPLSLHKVYYLFHFTKHIPTHEKKKKGLNVPTFSRNTPRLSTMKIQGSHLNGKFYLMIDN